MVRLAQAHSALGQVLFEMGRWDDALTEFTIIHQSPFRVSALIRAPCWHGGGTNAARAGPARAPCGRRAGQALAGLAGRLPGGGEVGDRYA